MILVHANELNILFENKIKNLNVDFPETKSYIIGLYCEYVKKNIILSSKQSISLHYLNANSFIDYQELGDHILFCRSMYPKSLTATPNFYDNIAKKSYHKCFLLMNKSWPVFEELSTNFSYLVNHVQV